MTPPDSERRAEHRFRCENGHVTVTSNVNYRVCRALFDSGRCGADVEYALIPPADLDDWETRVAEVERLTAENERLRSGIESEHEWHGWPDAGCLLCIADDVTTLRALLTEWEGIECDSDCESWADRPCTCGLADLRSRTASFLHPQPETTEETQP